MENRLYEEYAKWVEDNPDKVCAKVKLAVKKVRELEKDDSVYYDESQPQEIIDNIQSWIYDANGLPFDLLDWQVFFIANIYGWRTLDGDLLVNDAFLFIAKKNGKTGLLAALALYHLLTTPSGSVVLVAVDYTQTKICYNAILDILKNTPIFSESIALDEIHFTESSNNLSIIYNPLGSRIRLFPCTRSKAAQGQRPTFLLFDEIGSYEQSDIINKLKTGQGNRNALCISLTTAEKNQYNAGKDEYDRAEMALTGKVKQPNYFPLCYELDSDDRFDDPSKWIKPNPSLDRIPTKSTKLLAQAIENAKTKPQDLAGIKAYLLNIWQTSSTSGISDSQWKPCIDNVAKYKKHLSESKLKSYPAFVGLDLSKIDDYTAMTIYFYISEIDKYYARHKFFIPAALVDDKSGSEVEQVRSWVDSDYIRATMTGTDADNTVNYAQVLKCLIDWTKQYNIKALVIDPDQYAVNVFIPMLDRLLQDLPYIKFTQKTKMPEANTAWLEAIFRGQVIDDNPVMNWHRSCAEYYPARDSGGIMFKKIDYKKSTKRKDGITSSAMAYKMLWEHLQSHKDDKPVEEVVNSVLAALAGLK